MVSSTIDRKLRKAFVELSTALVQRYGSATDCTRAQIEKTVLDLGIAEDVLPYAAAAFERAEGLLTTKASRPEMDWEKVEAIARRVLSGIRSRTSNNDHFYESNIGYPTD